MAALMQPRRRASIAKIFAFWILLTLTMLIITQALGMIVERTADRVSGMIMQHVDLSRYR